MNDNERTEELVTSVRELGEMYQREIKRYKNLNRQLRAALDEINHLKQQFQNLIDTYT